MYTTYIEFIFKRYANITSYIQIQNMLGGRIRLMATGAAPLKPQILEFFRAALGATVYEVSLLLLRISKNIEICHSDKQLLTLQVMKNTQITMPIF